MHPERLEDLSRRVLIQPLAAHAPDDVAEEKEVDVAVDEALARRGVRHFFDRAPDGFVGAVEFNLELEVGPQSGRVRQQMPDLDARLAIAPELRDELRDRLVQPDASFLHELHHARGRRHHFGERGEIEDGVLGHRLGRGRHRPLAEGGVVRDGVAAADQDDGAGQLVTGNRRLDQRSNGRESGA